MTDQIKVLAVVAKVQTLVDGGVRITLDLPETATKQAMQFMECKRDEIVLNLVCTPC